MIAVVADIHGNLPALQAVLTDIDRAHCESIVSLGDVAGYYWAVNECIDALRDRRVFSLLGNHDYYLAFGKRCPRSHSANACLDYQRTVISDENKSWLSTLKPNAKLDFGNIVHGGWHDPLDEYLYEIDSDYFADVPGKVMLSGHTHVQILAELGDKVYCNPGSVGQPRDGDPRAAYAIVDGPRIELRRVEYDIDLVAKGMSAAGFDERFYENLYHGTRIGGWTPRS